MNQGLRNKIYGVAAGAFTILVVLGVVDQAQSNEGTTLVQAVLDQVDAVIGLGVSILAFVKSLRSRTTTLDLPATRVKEVVSTTGTVYAGPASPAPDGTVVGYSEGVASADSPE